MSRGLPTSLSSGPPQEKRLAGFNQRTSVLRRGTLFGFPNHAPGRFQVPDTSCQRQNQEITVGSLVYNPVTCYRIPEGSGASKFYMTPPVLQGTSHRGSP